jgi:hypothetical protein
MKPTFSILLLSVGIATTITANLYPRPVQAQPTDPLPDEVVNAIAQNNDPKIQ